MQWPSTKWAQHPKAFCTDVLGVEPWSAQVEILEAVRDHSRVAVRSGHKVGKSDTGVFLALWFYCSFPDARVVFTSVTSRQVDAILWRQLRKRLAKARIPIDGVPHEIARSGLKAPDFREIVGFTAREAEAVAGISGANLLYIADEASGIDDKIFEAIEGNRAGGARICMFSNPTRTEGEFFAAFHAKKHLYRTLAVSSEDTPNCRQGKVVVPGLATREWVEEKRQEWGEDSPLFKVRVRGDFALLEDRKILSVHAIGEAEARWQDAPADGPLQIGVDPAGIGEQGDETAMAVRRGRKVLEVVTWRGLSEEAILVHLSGLVRKHAKHRELARVVVDRDGDIGAKVWSRLRAHTDLEPNAFELVGIRNSELPRRQPDVYNRLRDELWANLSFFVRNGGAIPEDAKLSAELHAPEWQELANGRLKATAKDELRKALGRSPDRADAVALAVLETEPAEIPDNDSPRPGASDNDAAPVLDPYAAADFWTR